MGQAGHQSPRSDHCSGPSVCVEVEGVPFCNLLVALGFSCRKSDPSMCFFCVPLSASLSLCLSLSLSLSLFPSPLILDLSLSLGLYFWPLGDSVPFQVSVLSHLGLCVPPLPWIFLTLQLRGSVFRIESLSVCISVSAYFSWLLLLSLSFSRALFPSLFCSPSPTPASPHLRCRTNRL